MYWPLGLKSKLSTNNRILIYKAILQPICTYGIQLWGTASTSNIEILEHFEPSVMLMILDAPWLSAEYGYSNGYPNANS
jgi:hypothetical protein